MFSMSHTMQWVFIGCAVVVVLIALLGFAWALFAKDKTGDKERARLEDVWATRRHQYQQLTERKATLSEAEFAQAETRLARALVADVTLGSQAAQEESTMMRSLTLLAIAIVVPATSAGLYLTYGDYSALDERAIAQIEAVRTEEERAKEMVNTLAVLEEAVKKHPDQLDAWEVLADQYTYQENWPKAVEAWRNVMRLKPNDVLPAVNFLDVMVANDKVDDPLVAETVERILKLDPHEQKTLLLAGLLAFNKADYTHAVLYWNRLRQQVPEGDEMRQVLDTNIDSAMKAGNLTSLPLDTVAPPEPVMMKGGSRLPDMGQGAGQGMGANPMGGAVAPGQAPRGMSGFPMMGAPTVPQR